MAGPIKISVIAETAAAARGLAETESGVRGVGKAAEESEGGVGRFVEGIKRAAEALALFELAHKALEFGEDSFKSALDYQKVVASTTTALKNSNGVSGQSIKAIKERATALQESTGGYATENELIQSQNLLLAAGVKGQHNFAESVQAAADIAVAKQTSVSAASATLAKALADPDKAAGKLARTGIILSDAQQKQIKSFEKAGESAKAQGVILDAIEKKYHGVATAAGDTLAGKLKAAKDSIDDTGRDIALALLPAVAKVAGAFAKDLPKALDFVKDKFDAVEPTLSKIVQFFETEIPPALAQAKKEFKDVADAVSGPLKTAVADVEAVFSTLKPEIEDVASAFADKLPGAVSAVETTFSVLVTTLQNPVFQAVAESAAAVAAAYAVYAVAVEVVTGVTKALAVVQAVLNTEFEVSPVGLLVVALVALGAGLILAYRNSATFRDIVKNTFDVIEAAAKVAFDIIKVVGPAAFSFVVAAARDFEHVVEAVWPVISEAAKVAFNIVKTIVGVDIDIVKAYIKTIEAVGKFVFQTIPDAAKSAFSAVRSAVSAGVSAVISAVHKVEAVAGIIGGAFEDAYSAAKSAISKVVSAVGSILGKVKSAAAGFGSALVAAGQALVAGLVRGIESELGSALSAVKNLAGKVVGAAKSALKVNSPAKVMIPIGSAVPEGLAVGVENGTGYAVDAVTKMAAKVTDATKRAVDTSSLTDIATNIATGFVKSFTGSTDDIASAATSLAQSVTAANTTYSSALFDLNGQISSAAKDRSSAYADLAKATASGNAEVQKAQDKLDAAESSKSKSRAALIKSAQTALTQAKADAKSSEADASAALATSQATLSQLQAQLSYLNKSFAGVSTLASVKAAQQAILTFSQTMYDLATQRAAIATQLVTANQGLSDAISVRDSAIAQYKASALQFAQISAIDITSTQDAVSGIATFASGQDSAFASLQAGLADKLTAITTFTTKLKALVAAGLGSDLLKQVADLGPSAGSAYADAILQGGATGIAQLNTLQSQISSAATDLGNYGGTQLYQSGVDAAQGIVDGLQSQDAALAATATQLAETFQKSFLTSLKIPDAQLDAVTQYFSGLAAGTLNAQVPAAGSLLPIAGTTAAVSGKSGSPVAVTLPAKNQITSAADGKAIVDQLVAYQKQYGSLSIVLGS